MLYDKQNFGARHEQFSTRFGCRKKIWLCAKNYRNLHCNARFSALQCSNFFRAIASDSQLDRHFFLNRQVRQIADLDGVDLIPRIAPCSASDVTAGSSAWKENGCSITTSLIAAKAELPFKCSMVAAVSDRAQYPNKKAMKRKRQILMGANFFRCPVAVAPDDTGSFEPFVRQVADVGLGEECGGLVTSHANAVSA